MLVEQGPPGGWGPGAPYQLPEGAEGPEARMMVGDQQLVGGGQLAVDQPCTRHGHLAALIDGHPAGFCLDQTLLREGSLVIETAPERFSGAGVVGHLGHLAGQGGMGQGGQHPLAAVAVLAVVQGCYHPEGAQQGDHHVMQRWGQEHWFVVAALAVHHPTQALQQRVEGGRPR